MADEIYQPHDKLFRTVFSDSAEAASLLQAYLPEAISREFNWATLTLLDGTFVDEGLRESESDLLYEIEHLSSHEPVWVYILFEHQSSPDAWMRFRLLKYCCRIWDASFHDAPGQLQLRPILPLVFYQGHRRWHYSTEFADLFPEMASAWPFIPRFAHTLIDQTEMEPGSVEGGLKGRILQLLMMAAFDKYVAEAMERAAQLAADLPPSGGINYIRLFVFYVMATQDRAGLRTFGEVLQRYGAEHGGEVMTYAQELLEAGRAEGEQRGKVEVIEGLLRVGVDWQVIEAGTGINEAQFQLLKQQLENTAEGETPRHDGE
jgi:predicted transposase YdaD